MYAQFLHLLQHFPYLGAWQKRGLALWNSGVVLAGACRVSAVADALVAPERPSVEALEKRLSRFLHNERVSDELLSQAWVGWVVERYVSAHWVVLVDETKLSDHLSVMMVSLAYQQRAIPLLWRCYCPSAYPPEGQVALIRELLARLRLWVPSRIALTVQADRGIGTSPDLIRELELLGLMYLLRVQGQTRVRLANRQVHPLAQMVKPGETWCGRVEVFKKAGWLPLWVCIYWRVGERSPWCLVTNCRWRCPADYALRAWQEQSFRDLKSFGFHWNASHVWQPAHAQRLLFILALAYTWVLSQALLHTPAEPLSPSRQHPRQSLFRRGLRWVRHQLALTKTPSFSLDLHFHPPSPLLC